MPDMVAYMYVYIEYDRHLVDILLTSYYNNRYMIYIYMLIILPITSAINNDFPAGMLVLPHGVVSPELMGNTGGNWH